MSIDFTMLTTIIGAIGVISIGVRQLVETIKGIVPYSKLTQPITWLTFDGQAMQVQQLIDILLVFGFGWAASYFGALNIFSPFGVSVPLWIGAAVSGLIGTLPASLVNSLVTWVESLAPSTVSASSASTTTKATPASK